MFHVFLASKYDLLDFSFLFVTMKHSAGEKILCSSVLSNERIIIIL